MPKLMRLIILLLVLLAMPGAARARQGTPLRVEVFLEQDPQTGEAKIYFMDPLSGLSTVVNVESGQQFTLVGGTVIYEKSRTGAIMQANPDGTLEPHPFIRRAVDTQSLRWVVSQDGQSIAWVTVSQAGVSQAYAAWADGSDLRQLPISTPGDALELFPLALSNSMTQFFYDAAAPMVPAEGPYRTYSLVALYNLLDEAFLPLDEEPDCDCGAAVSADGRILARLEGIQGIGPFALHIWDLPTGADIRIDPPNLNFAYAGDLIVNSTGTFAAYSAADTLTPDQYVLVLVNLVDQTQTAALVPGPARYQPLAFIDGDRALLLAGITEGGTYKLDLASGELRRVSNDLYLGAITTTP